MLCLSFIPLGRSLAAQTLEAQAGFGVKLRPALTSSRCEFRGRVPEYKGTCFRDESGNLVYWIVRRWEDGEPVGPGYIGYQSVLDQQNEYNRWAIANTQPDGQIVWGANPSRGWVGVLFELPLKVSDIGALDGDSIRIPHFMTGRQILLLWSDLQEDCRGLSEMASAQACGKRLQEYVKGDLPEPNPALRVRANQLKEAYEGSVAFGTALDRAGVVGKDAIYDPLPEYLTAIWAAAHEKVLQAIWDAERLKAAYREAAR